MIFEHNDKTKELIARVEAFMDKYVYPNEATYDEQMIAFGEDRWQIPQILEDLKVKAKEEGLWNMFLPESERGGGLTNVEYAPICEIMGRVGWASEVFNCSAPDTGNMELIERYGTEEHKEKWLQPLLEGEMRSAYLMTEPDVASSDATNISTKIERDGDEYVINGRKWWSSGVMDPRCKVAIVMGKTNPDASRHQQQSQILVPMETPGVEIVRHLPVFGFDDAPHGHMHLRFTNVRVPKENCLLGPGRGFEISQGRLGPGRIHHCMRLVGQAEKALELLCKRGLSRIAFGRELVKLGGNYDVIADSRIEIESARLLTLKAARKMDLVGNKEARGEISQIKVYVPNITLNIIDRAIQMHGGIGISQRTPLAKMWANARTLRFADGPDEVHRIVVARIEFLKYQNLNIINDLA